MPTLAQSLPLTYSLNEEILTHECGYCLSFAMYIPEDGDFLSVLFTIGSLLPEQHLTQ